MNVTSRGDRTRRAAPSVAGTPRVHLQAAQLQAAAGVSRARWRALAQHDAWHACQAAPLEPGTLQRGIGAEDKFRMADAEAVAQLLLEIGDRQLQVQFGGRLPRLDAKQFAGALHDQPGAAQCDGRFGSLLSHGDRI